jgi:hypothetical protein
LVIMGAGKVVEMPRATQERDSVRVRVGVLKGTRTPRERWPVVDCD